MATQYIVDSSVVSERQHDYHAHAHAEYAALCTSIRDRLRSGTLPADEAYWWARILCDEAMARLTDRCRAGIPDRDACGTDGRCERQAA